MNFNGLYSEVLELGFESGAYPVSSVLTAANRALSTLYSERRLRKTAYLHFAELPSKIPMKGVTAVGRSELALPTGGVGLAAFGNGRVILSGNGGERSYKVSGQAFIRERCEGGRIIFIGETSLEITDFAVYPGYSGAAEAIPVAGKRRTDLKASIADFGALTAAPRDNAGRPIASEVYGHTLLLPESFSGGVRLEYLPLPKRISDSDPYAEIDLPCELEVLLPLLTAAYVWLDAEAEKAEYYLERYHELSAAIPNLSGVRSESYITNGWA